ncbi:MAG: protein-tyrosine phosphatase family protein [Agriterribacter sp.]
MDSLTRKIDEGQSVVIHCRMGIGRSSIIAACVLLKYKLKAKVIIENISSIRGLKVPDTDEQLSWLMSRE